MQDVGYCVKLRKWLIGTASVSVKFSHFGDWCRYDSLTLLVFFCQQLRLVKELEVSIC